MKYQENDIINIDILQGEHKDCGFWLGVITKTDGDYYTITWLLAALGPVGTSLYRVEGCDNYDDLKLYCRMK